MKKVNPKSIKISDEIEKRPKQGVIVIFRFSEDSKLARFKLICITYLILVFIPNDYRVSLGVWCKMFVFSVLCGCVANVVDFVLSVFAAWLIIW